MCAETIKIIGASERNLKGVSVEIPHQALCVITGPSGSGKSTLLFDVIGREAARQLELVAPGQGRIALAAPAVEQITGLEVTVSLAAFPHKRALNSIGRYLQAADLLALIFHRFGSINCRSCCTKLEATARPDMAVRIGEWLASAGLDARTERITIGARFLPADQAEYAALSARLLAAGYSRIVVDGQLAELSTPSAEYIPGLPLDLVVDRGAGLAGNSPRLEEALSLSLELSGDRIFVMAGGLELALSPRSRCPNCGFSTPALSPDDFKYWRSGRCETCHGRGEVPAGGKDIRSTRQISCPDCQGSRLGPLARSSTVAGLTLGRALTGDIAGLRGFFAGFASGWRSNSASFEESVIGIELEAICRRFDLLAELGLGYLNLTRDPASLSTGEMQRLLIARHLAQPVNGVTYLLDEPSAGLHPRDVSGLIAALKKLTAEEDTVIAVDHDSAMIEAADNVLVLGPGSGTAGGELICSGPPSGMEPFPPAAGPAAGAAAPGRAGWITIEGAGKNNLKNLTARFPRGVVTAVAGVSGSGKTTLIRDCLAPLLLASFAGQNRRLRSRLGPVISPDEQAGVISGADGITGVIDLTGITGKSMRRRRGGVQPDRAAVCTVLGVMHELRTLYARTVEARVEGFGPERFSFLDPKSACPRCRGSGAETEEGGFSSRCPECGGLRYQPEIERVRFKGISIGRALQLTIAGAKDVFGRVPRIRRLLDSAAMFGLDYLVLGQPARSLSSGEIQRLRLAARLHSAAGSGRVILLDEPSFGLDRAEVRRLGSVLDKLSRDGNTVIVIEHNLELIARAGWIVELGPQAGQSGGTLIAAGTAPEIRANRQSLIAEFLQ